MHYNSQAPEDGCANIRNMLTSKLWNNKASDIKLIYLYSTKINKFKTWMLNFCDSKMFANDFYDFLATVHSLSVTT